MSLDTLGLGTSSGDTLESFNPSTPEEFTEYSDALCKKIRQHKAKEGYPNFLDELVRTLCAGRKFLLKFIGFVTCSDVPSLQSLLRQLEK